MHTITYTFAIIPYSNIEMEVIECKVRTLLTNSRMHHPQAAKERHYIARNKGGGAVTNLEQEMRCKYCTINCSNGEFATRKY